MVKAMVTLPVKHFPLSSKQALHLGGRRRGTDYLIFTMANPHGELVFSCCGDDVLEVGVDTFVNAKPDCFAEFVRWLLWVEGWGRSSVLE